MTLIDYSLQLAIFAMVNICQVIKTIFSFLFRLKNWTHRVRSSLTLFLPYFS